MVFKTRKWNELFYLTLEWTFYLTIETSAHQAFWNVCGQLFGMSITNCRVCLFRSR